MALGDGVPKLRLQLLHASPSGAKLDVSFLEPRVAPASSPASGVAYTGLPGANIVCPHRGLSVRACHRNI